ncbi:hypothetical protein J4526_07415 [Desulfurococcaceae archaeon MEX13E-LK6-19]|nr:hypothetical protein J4526_07415 [Desulfurococcaceae archaeon MEX13E-LK6-19]
MLREKDIASLIKSIIEKFKSMGLDCSVSLKEFMTYINALTYEDEKTSIDDILGNEFLILHEVAEICFLKNMGYKIDEKVILNAYPRTYEAHLKAMEIELKEAQKKGSIEWIEKRCKDLESYWEDPMLPLHLRPLLTRLMKTFCMSLK